MSIFDLSPASFDVVPVATQRRIPIEVQVPETSGPLAHGQSVCLVGKLLHLKVLPSGWAVGRINTEEHGDVGVNGNALAGLTEKQVYEFAGTVEMHKTYGLQHKVESVGLHVPASPAGIEKFLSQNYKGVGKKAASKIIQYFQRQPGGLRQFRLELLANPYSMDFSKAGVKRKTSMDTADGLKSLIYMDIATKIGGVELGDKLLRKIAAYLEEPAKASSNPIERAWSILTENPYAPIRDLDGYAFKTADSVARKVGFDLSRPERTAALVTHAIGEGCNASGHSYLTLADFNKIIKAIDPSVDVKSALDAAMQMEEPMVIDGDRYYLEQIYKAEVFLAKNLFERYNRPLRTQIHNGSEEEIKVAVREAQAKIGFKLDESQHKAVYGLLTSYSPLHTITAGPGCGKTTIMEVVVQVLQGRTKLLHNPETGVAEATPYRIGFCAPTGKAAKVLNARVSRFGARACTIHALLKVRGSKPSPEESEGSPGGSSMFVHNHWNRLDLDLVVVDEASMVDLALLFAFISALPDTCHIVFLGDPKQLPSVGPGACLADLLKMPFDHHHLHSTHRNDGGILEVVTMAGAGQVDFRSRLDVTFIDGLAPATEASISSVMDLYDKALDLSMGDFSRVGLLIARRKGDPHTPGWNSTYLNSVLREGYNPEHARRGGSATHIEGIARAGVGERIYGTRYRVGDRVIIRKNLTLGEEGEGEEQPEQVVNGDTGIIRDFKMGGGNLKAIEILLDDGRTVFFPAGDVDVLDFSYAMTVHTAQGSEYDQIIFISVNGHSSFVHRGIVFTGFSRAKKHLTIIGDREALQAIVARPAPHRNSHLVPRLQRHIAKRCTSNFEEAHALAA